MGVAFDGACHIIVADGGNFRVLVLRYRDGKQIRTIGSRKNGFMNPKGVLIDGQGRIIVSDALNHCLQVLQ
jgi:hypothetical protein